MGAQRKGGSSIKRLAAARRSRGGSRRAAFQQCRSGRTANQDAAGRGGSRSASAATGALRVAVGVARRGAPDVRETACSRPR
jgi:hypothetical protein